MKSTKFITTVSSVLAVSVFFSGCAGITHEPSVDVSSLPVVSEENFYNALSSIGIADTDTSVIEDSSFTFSESDIEFDVIINIDGTSVNSNEYSYTRCVDEETAKALFDYYYEEYEPVFDMKEFSGISSHESGEDYGYILIDGRVDSEENGISIYTPYHDAIFLKGDTVIVAIASDYEKHIEDEVDKLLDSIGYPHP